MHDTHLSALSSLKINSFSPKLHAHMHWGTLSNLGPSALCPRRHTKAQVAMRTHWTQHSNWLLECEFA